MSSPSKAPGVPLSKSSQQKALDEADEISLGSEDSEEDSDSDNEYESEEGSESDDEELGTAALLGPPISDDEGDVSFEPGPDEEDEEIVEEEEEEPAKKKIKKSTE
mmetsp:Transcript_17476/g.32557  ORF Transcript_17476/g.32557 Transcript_17476/m.32557 type:complete len:106 (+) Transcript_17476:39-356(+)